MTPLLLAALMTAPAQPPIRVWLSTPRSDIYVRTGDPVRVLFRSAEDGYVLILRINAEGKVQMLFPGDPGDTAPVPGGGTYEVLGRGQPESFVVDESDGNGFVLGAWSSRPFRLERFARKDSAGGWDYSAINALAERARREAPRSALVHLARVIAEDSAFEYDLTAYTVANQPAVIAEAPPPYEDERQAPPQNQMPETVPPDYYPPTYPYPYVAEYYQPAYDAGGHHHHRGFVPCEWQCYPGSPNTLVGFGDGRRGASTGTGLIIGRGDPAGYLAVPQKPKTKVVTAAIASARSSAPATRAAIVPSRALVASAPSAARPVDRRPEDKIRFGPVAPLRPRPMVVEAPPVRTATAAQTATPQARAVTVAAPAAVRAFPNRIPTVTQPQGYATIEQPRAVVASGLQPTAMQSWVSPARPAATRAAGAVSPSAAGAAGPGTRAYVGPARPVVVRAK
jgi:hypothetical protein